MNGNHKADKGIEFTLPTITMFGESQKASIQYSAIYFVNNNQVTVKNLTFDNSTFLVSPSWNEYNPLVIHILFESVKLYYNEVSAYIEGANVDLSMQFTGCKFHNGTLLFGAMKVNFTDCELVNNIMTLGGVPLRISGVSEIRNAQTSAITCYFCPIELSGTISFVNNTAVRGGAMALHTSTLYIDANTKVIFANNTAKDRGGAIFTVPSLQPYPLNNSYVIDVCFYQTLNCNNTAYYNVYFDNNLAINGGDDIYGSTSETYCFRLEQACRISMIHESYKGHSSISSNPTRICLCDKQGIPQCQNRSYDSKTYAIYPGETFIVSAVVVGGHFGTTVGTVHAGFLDSPALSLLKPTSQYGQAIDNKHCTTLNYTVYSNQTNSTVVMYLSPVLMMDNHDVMFYTHYDYYTPILVDLKILPCPPGFILTADPPRCTCYKALTDKLVKCDITNGTGYMFWSGNMWVNISKQRVTYIGHCPFSYCIVTGKKIDMQTDPDSQCAFNRAGRLCGGCKDGYSVAIGSSHCIHCPNNNNLALFIFFAAAGFLLVLFIGALNLTVSQGMINGLIFYANIVWTYKTVFFPQEQKISGVLVFLRTFIAWVNLDFGIEVCFVSGLTTFWKTWLQFVFPAYIFTITGLTVLAISYLTKQTSLLRNRGVSVLGTIFLLSYMKIMRIIIATMNPSTLMEYPSRSDIVVWSEDGNLTYFGLPHIFLFIAGLAAIFLWLPYTLILLMIGCFRRVPLSRLLKWTKRFSPLFDAYFAPLKHQHKYWFGVLLLARGILLICFASTLLDIPQCANLLILFVVGVILLFYVTIILPHRNRDVLLVNGSFLANLALLSGFALFTETQPNGSTLKLVIITLSTGLAFLKFCGIVIYGTIATRYFKKQNIDSVMQAVISFLGSNSDEKQPLLNTQGT